MRGVNRSGGARGRRGLRAPPGDALRRSIGEQHVPSPETAEECRRQKGRRGWLALPGSRCSDGKTWSPPCNFRKRLKYEQHKHTTGRSEAIGGGAKECLLGWRRQNWEDKRLCSG